MKRKRTKLDTIEANFIYAKVLVSLGKFKGFSELPIPTRNSLIDSACEEIIEAANSSEEDIEALKFEIKSYKLTDEEKTEFYGPAQYDETVKKPENFNQNLKEKYSGLIREITKKKEERIQNIQPQQ